MKKLFLKPFDKIVLALLSCIAFFTGCDVINPPVAEYGVPTAEFEIKGTITDSITSQPVKNIRVIRQYPSAPQYGDTLYTDVQGKYQFNFNSFPVDDPTFHLKVEDIDGANNGGEFANKELDVVIADADWIDDGDDNSWYYGKAVKTQNIKLKKK